MSFCNISCVSCVLNWWWWWWWYHEVVDEKWRVDSREDRLTCCTCRCWRSWTPAAAIRASRRPCTRFSASSTPGPAAFCPSPRRCDAGSSTPPPAPTITRPRGAPSPPPTPSATASSRPGYWWSGRTTAAPRGSCPLRDPSCPTSSAPSPFTSHPISSPWLINSCLRGPPERQAVAVCCHLSVSEEPYLAGCLTCRSRSQRSQRSTKTRSDVLSP